MSVDPDLDFTDLLDASVSPEEETDAVEDAM